MCDHPPVPWQPLIATLTGALVAGGFALGGDQTNLHNALIAVSALVMGASILRFHAVHREGLLFMAIGAVHAVMFFGRQYGRHPSYPAARWITWLGVWPLPAVLVLVAATVMCYPDGRLPGRRWVGALVVLGSVGGVLTIVSALWSVEYDRMGLDIRPPFVLPGRAAATSFFDVARPVCYTAVQATWAACIVARLVRARAAEARQIRWLVFAVLLNGLVLVGGLIVTGEPKAALLTVPLLPVAGGIGIIAYSYEALVAELRASTKRIVTAQDEARRRIERDLHDGVQHRLVVLGIELGRLVDHADAAGERELADLARSSRDQLLQATAELRELARGIHPTVLAEDGLEAALGMLADRSPIPVRLSVDLDRSCGTEAEATAFYVASEGLTNASRYSGAGHVTVSVARSGEMLELVVADNGVGGAQLLRGRQGLADRVNSLGGRFRVESPAGGGTRLEAAIPCA